MPREPIVIVGAGIVGASIAYHLAKRGAEVVVLEASQAAAGASGKSFGWINATFSKRPRHYFDFNVQAIREWHRLEKELSISVQWGGSVAWCAPGVDAKQLAADVRHHRDWGYAVGDLDQPELKRLLPAVTPGDVATACFCELEGAVDPIETVNALLPVAPEIRVVEEIDSFGGTIVLACGVGIPRLASTAGVRIALKDSPGVLVHSTPLPKLLDSVAIAPGVHFRQTASGRIVAGGQLVAGLGTAATEANIEDAAGIFEHASRYLPALRDAKIDYMTLGHRVMPDDEYPIVGFAKDRLYVAATHSGVTLAPLIGRLAASEILDGAREPMLDPYRPARFA